MVAAARFARDAHVRPVTVPAIRSPVAMGLSGRKGRTDGPAGRRAEAGTDGRADGGTRGGRTTARNEERRSGAHHLTGRSLSSVTRRTQTGAPSIYSRALLACFGRPTRPTSGRVRRVARLQHQRSSQPHGKWLGLCGQKSVAHRRRQGLCVKRVWHTVAAEEPPRKFNDMEDIESSKGRCRTASKLGPHTSAAQVSFLSPCCMAWKLMVSVATHIRRARALF